MNAYDQIILIRELLDDSWRVSDNRAVPRSERIFEEMQRRGLVIKKESADE